MKSVNKITEKKRKGLKKPKIKPKKEKVLVVAQEIKFARLLSGNEKKTRDRVLKSFKKWLLGCFQRGYEFKEDDFIRVWKGLFYAVWMSDKPLIQEELCETIAGILDLFPTDQIESAFLMTKAGFRVLATEWYGIDQHRMDKFLMLVRRYLRGSIRCLARCEWKTEVCDQFANAIAGEDGILSPQTPIYARNAGSMLLHVLDCYLEELAKVSAGSMPDEALVSLARPLCACAALGATQSLCTAARRALTQLLRQSDRGLEYRERTRAWEQMGCPIGGPDALELASDDDDDDEEQNEGNEEQEGEDTGTEAPLDPRAGRVDVELHSLPVPGAALAQELKKLLAGAGSKAHKRTKICMERFEQLARDEYPLRVADVRDSNPEPRVKLRRGATELKKLERSLVASADELALRGLSRKHRKRLLAKSRAGLSILGDVPHADITSTNGDWAVEATESKKEQLKSKEKRKTENKENVNKDKNAKKRPNADTVTKTNSIKTKNAKTKDNEPNKSNKPAPIAKPVKNNTNINNNVNKAKNEKPVEKKVQNNKQNLVKNAEEKPKQVTNGLKSPPKNVKVEITPKKVKKMEKPTKSVSPKDNTKNKVLNGKIEKRRQESAISKSFDTPKKVKFVLKNNCMQGTMDYYKSVRQSPSIPYDSSKKPSKTNLKVSTPSPINPFFKKKLRLK